MEENLIQIKNDAMSLILNSEKEEIEKIYIDFLGKKGRLTVLMKELPKLPVEKRSEIGKLANSIKDMLEEQINDRRKDFKHQPKELQNKDNETQKKTETNIDVTLPGIKPPLGTLHLVT